MPNATLTKCKVDRMIFTDNYVAAASPPANNVQNQTPNSSVGQPQQQQQVSLPQQQTEKAKVQLPQSIDQMPLPEVTAASSSPKTTGLLESSNACKNVVPSNDIQNGNDSSVNGSSNSEELSKVKEAFDDTMCDSNDYSDDCNIFPLPLKHIEESDGHQLPNQQNIDPKLMPNKNSLNVVPITSTQICSTTLSQIQNRCTDGQSSYKEFKDETVYGSVKYAPQKKTLVYDPINELRKAELRKNAPIPIRYPPRNTHERLIKEGKKFVGKDDDPTEKDAPSDWNPTPEDENDKKKKEGGMK